MPRYGILPLFHVDSKIFRRLISSFQHSTHTWKAFSSVSPWYILAAMFSTARFIPSPVLRLSCSILLQHNYLSQRSRFTIGTTITNHKHIPMLQFRGLVRGFLQLAVLTYLFEYMDWLMGFLGLESKDELLLLPFVWNCLQFWFPFLCSPRQVEFP